MVAKRSRELCGQCDGLNAPPPNKPTTLNPKGLETKGLETNMRLGTFQTCSKHGGGYIYLYLNPRSSPQGLRDFSGLRGLVGRKHRTVAQNGYVSLSGRLGATRPSRMASESSKDAARASTGTTTVLQSGIRGCLRATTYGPRKCCAAQALERAARA